MFEIGWTEMLVIAIVLIVVVGPKDLPKMLRTFGKMTAKMTSMAGEFRKQFDDAMKEAELDDVRKTIDSARKLNPTGEIKKALNPVEKAAQDVKAGLDLMAKPKPQDIPSATAEAAPAEPLKAGATAVPAAATATNGSAAPSATAAPEKPARAAPASKAKSAAGSKPARSKKAVARKSSGAAS